MIFIDASRYQSTNKRTGVENYSFFLINELVKKHKEEITLITPKKIDLKVKQIVIPFPRLWTHIRLSWEVICNKKIDNLFIPSHVLPILHPKNCTITIHDVAFKYSPESYSFLSRLYLDWATRFAIKKAKKIIVPSQKTKEDLLHYYKANPKKITIIPLGFKAPNLKIKTSSVEHILKKYKLKKEMYFLAIGRIEYKKNTDTLLKAFKSFADKHKNMKLVLAGFPGYGGKEILEKIPKALRRKIVLTGYISEEEKVILLQSALAFIFPSRFEGFGIPLLEAMHAKVPIIASNIPTSKEIAKGAAFFFEKENAVMLTDRMKKILTNPGLKKKFSNYEKILKKHSWILIAEKTFGIIGPK